MPRPLPCLLALSAALCAHAAPAAADAQETPVGPSQPPRFPPGVRPAAMGRAQNALSQGTASVYHNPAGLWAAKMYALDGAFGVVPGGSVLNAAVADSKTNPTIAAGAGFAYYFDTEDAESASAIDVRVPVAIAAVPERFVVGLGGRYVRAKDNGVEILNGFTIDAGVLAYITRELRLGAIGKNLLDPCQSARCEGFAPTTVGGGAAYVSDLLSIALDAEVDLNSTNAAKTHVEGGVEFLAAGMVPLRGGVRRDGLTGAVELSTGLGYVSRAAGFDVSYEHNLERAQFGRLWFGFSLFFMQDS